MKTAQELIDLLNKLEDKNQPIWFEGCDCYRKFSGTLEEKDDKNGKWVLLNSKSEYDQN